MESVPFIPKAKVLPNLDAAPLLRELFQEEFQAVLPTQKLSENILTSVQYQKPSCDDKETYKSVQYLENLTNRKDNVIEFTENVLEAYKTHKNNLDEIRNAEKNIFETHAQFLNRQVAILENKAISDLISLKRQPLFRSLDVNYVKKYKLLQGEAGLPLEYEIHSDFRVKNFKKCKKKLESSDPIATIMGYLNKTVVIPQHCKLPLKSPLPEEPKKVRKPRPKNKKVEEAPEEILRAEPKVVFFTEYKLGDVYIAEISVKNMHSKGVQFQIKPTSPDGPFKVTLDSKCSTKVFAGLSFQLTVEFTPRSLDNAAEDLVIVTEDGNRLLIPLIAYLEPPILKTHKEVDEFTKITAEKIASSYIECGACFTGDTKVTKLRFRCYRGGGEFFIMSSENWSRSYVNTVTFENLLEIPPFHVYPVYFKMEKDEVIDLYVEFKPETSGMHVENIVIACDNGEIRFLDLIGDAVGWHSYYFSFQDSLLKTLPAEEDDDVKVKYLIDFEDCTQTEKLERAFCVCNNSNMAFEFQWKIREANIHSQEKYMKLSKYEVKIDPESGTFEANSTWEFMVTITFSNAEIGNYRMVLSLYVLNLPYQCIQEDNTIIQPTGLVRNLYSQSLYGEEEGAITSPELASLQGTYESLQESIKSYVECQTKAQAVMRNDFCRTTCIPNPGLCAKPLKKSKTFFNIGDNLDEEGLSCVCRMRPVEPESNSESCTSNTREEKTNDLSPQRNEVIWDFVDVLVDEIELWVEVVPSRVTLEPVLLDFGSSLKVNDPLVFKKVRIINHNRSSVKCSWKGVSTNDNETIKDKMSFSLLFDKNFGKKEKSKPNPKTLTGRGNGDVDDEDKEEISDNCEVIGSKTNITTDSCRITIKPQKTFLLPGSCVYNCEIGVSVLKPGSINEILYLSVNQDELELKLMITGRTVSERFFTTPEVLNFGSVRQGTRHVKDFKIINTDDDPLFWRINQYQFDFKKEKFLSYSSSLTGGAKTKEGIVRNKQSLEPYYLDGRVSGMKCLLLEIQGNKQKVADTMKRFVLVLADVKKPKLSLAAPRFENAILSPAKTMYVGQKISTYVTLTNISSVETFCNWGYPFGCHSRNIKVDIEPKSLRIKKREKLQISVQLTALEEGIISHCYIPCFFCRSAEPLILSIVAVVENMSVTFEIIDYPMQTHADPSTFLKSPFYHTVLRVPWPLKMYTPTLNKKYISENDLINMKCDCLQVEEEVNRVFGEQKMETPVPELPESGKSMQSLVSFEMSEEGSLKSKSSVRKKNGYDQDFKLSTSVLSGYEESKKSDEGLMPISIYADPSAEALRYVKSELEFLNVPFRTPIMRQFVIRNETPIATDFRINVLNYGICKSQQWSRIESIKHKVMGVSKDEFKEKLSKDRPLVIEVEPSEGELNGFDAVCINVFCYGNTWGEYRDFLICKIKGTEPFHLKMFIQIVGHPIHFPMFTHQQTLKPVLRFQPLSRIESPVSKEIKVVNRSSIPLNVSWIVFLMKPLLQQEEQEDSFNMCVESNHSAEDSVNSSKNYIPKNASASASNFGNAFDMMDSSQHSGMKSFENIDSSPDQKEKRDSVFSEKKFSIPSISDEIKSNGFPGRPDTQIFQVEPKKTDLEPFEEKKITITFDPHFGTTEPLSQEFKGVLTGCVRLKPEDEKCPGVYNRPCGTNFVSELMDFNAVVETFLLSFEILRGDLKFTVDSNAILKSESKQIAISRKFLIRNRNQKALSIKIEIVPGTLFKIMSVNTIDKFYPQYNSQKHAVKIEPGHLLEMDLKCTVSYKDVLYAFEQLKLNRIKNKCPESSEEMRELHRKVSKGSDEFRMDNEPWKQQQWTFANMKKITTDRRSLSHKDSFEINLNRMSSKSENSVCCDYSERGDENEEIEGEFLELSTADKIPCKVEPSHETVIEEEISFVQSGLVTQTLVAELHISFPVMRISPDNLDFGKVYLGETAVRYCSLINLTGFATDFTVKARCKAPEFSVNPLTGSLPPTNYNSDIGKTITIEFKPSEPGNFKEIFHVYCNTDCEFDFFEFFVTGFGTWNEKYKTPKLETYTNMNRMYPLEQK